MGSYCPVCDQFVENLDVCSEGEYHRDDYDPSCDYERYPMRDFSKWYRYEEPEPEPEPEPTFHLDDELSSDAIWYDGKVRTRSKSKQHRSNIVAAEVRKILNKIESTRGKPEKVKLFEIILLIFKENKWMLKNKGLADITIVKIDEFVMDSPEFRYLKSFKYQLFGMC